MTKKPIQVLLFEDNPGDARLFREYLHEDDLVQFGLDHVERLRTGLEHLNQGKPDVILLDLGLPDSQGLETFTQVYAQAQAVPIVVLTGLDDAKQAVEAVRAGAQDYLVKGEVSGGLLMRAIRYAIERKDAARTLRESEERYRLLVETLPDGVVVHSQGRVVFANPASAMIIGAASPADLTGKPVIEFVHPDYRERALKRIQQSLREGTPAPSVEEQFVRLDGTPIEVEVSAIPFSYAGEPSMLTVFNDVTVRKRAEQELLKLRKAVDTSGEVIFMTDREGIIIFANPEFTHLYGYAAAELIGKSTPRILKGGLIKAEHYEQLWHSLLNTQVVRGEFVNKTKDGRLLTIEGSINPILDDEQEVVGFLAIQRDITERKRAEEEIRHRLSQLEVLYASSLAIGQLLQPKEIGHKLTAIISDRLHWQWTTIHLYHRESDSIELLVFHQPGLEGEAERLAAVERLKTRLLQPGQGFVGWVIQHGLTVYCGDVTKDPRYLEAWPGMNSGMYVPMKAGESVIGCLSVESERVDAFGETDEWLLTTLATQAASALENARLLEETARGLKRVQALHTIDVAISSSLDLRLTVDVFLDEAVRQLGVDAADVLRFNPHTQTLEYLAGHGFRTDALQHTRLRLGEGYAGTAGLERRIIHIPDLQNRNTDSLRSPYFSSEGFEACFVVPLIAKGQLKGVLEIFHRTSLDNAGEEWQEFLETLAGQAAIAIDNISLFEELTRSNIELSLAYDSTIEGWSRALDLRDKETEGHTLRVSEITQRLARAADVGEAELVHIRRGALLHDMGKIGVPDGILLKPGPLTDEEWVVMRKHPQVAYDMLSPIAYLKPALDIPYCHHEKWDGTGYPRGLKGEQIPLAARLFAVVDVWDALRSDRPYRDAWPEEKVLEHIKGGSGTHFDPQAVELFFKMMSEEAHQAGQAAG